MHNTTYFHPHPPKFLSLIKYQPYVPVNRVDPQLPPLTLLKDLHKETHTTVTPPYIRKKNRHPTLFTHPIH